MHEILGTTLPLSTKNARIFSAGSVVFGSLMYICFRPTSIRVFSWIEAVGLSEVVAILRDQSAELGAHIPSAVLYSLPGGLWAFALALAVGSIWQGEDIGDAVPFVSAVIAMTVGSELAQGIGWLPGQFDVVDLFCYALGVISGIAITMTPKPNKIALEARSSNESI